MKAKPSHPPRVGKALLKKVGQFHTDSLAGRYYAPFPMNSKNWRHIPEETKEWTERATQLLEACCQLSAQGAHSEAVTGFERLYELLEAIDRGAEIIFAEEVGSWMIPMDEPKIIKAYMTSLAAVASAEKFTEVTGRLLRRDRLQSWSLKVFSTARQVATPEQKNYLRQEIEKQKIKTGK